MYQTGKSVNSPWGDWSEWTWSPEYKRHYRQRQDYHGNIDTEWEGYSNALDDQTPRESTDVDGLTDGLANLHTSASTAYDGQESEYAISGSSGSRSRSSKHKSSRSHHKGKGRAYPDEKERAASAYTAYPSAADHEEESGHYYSQTATGPYYDYQHDPQSQQGSEVSTSNYRMTSSNATYDSASNPAYTLSYEEEDPAFQAAAAASRAYNYSAHASGGSGDAYDTYGYEDEGPSTPKAQGSAIAGTEGDVETLDPRYRVEHSHKFQPGEIFKVLWSEPQGAGYEGAPSVIERREFKDRFGGKFFVGFRRFVVIANDQGHCACVPILTYGGKGCKKKGVKPEKHGIIYERGHKPKLLSGEPKLGFSPVKIDIVIEGEKLAKESRVNYSKLVTVEHNVKVLFIGHITPSDWNVVSDAVNLCWESKVHHGRRHFNK